jgi:hypothetical protein
LKAWQRDIRSYRFVQQILDAVSGATRLSIEDTDLFRNSWRKVFVPPEKCKAIPHHSCEHCPQRSYSHDWFHFSGNHFPKEPDPLKRMRESTHPMERVLVWTELCDKPAVELQFKELDDFMEANPPPQEELYIAPRKLSWTCIFTHEDSLGPYFCTAD